MPRRSNEPIYRFSLLATHYFFHSYLPPEHTIDEDEIPERQNHCNAPPHQSNTQPVMRRGAVVNGEAVFRICGGQHHRVQCERSADQHSYDVRARRKEGDLVFLLGSRPDHHAKASENYDGDENADRMRLEVVHHALFNEIGGYEATGSHKKLYRPEEHGGAACPLTEFAGGFQRDI